MGVTQSPGKASAPGTGHAALRATPPAAGSALWGVPNVADSGPRRRPFGPSSAHLSLIHI
eukprot:10252558-Alexandrium_andersonii.AAC.1